MKLRGVVFGCLFTFVGLNAGFGSWIRHVVHHVTHTVEHTAEHTAESFEHTFDAGIKDAFKKGAGNVVEITGDGVKVVVKDGVNFAIKSLSHNEFLSKIKSLFPSCAQAAEEVPTYAAIILSTDILNQALDIVQNDIISHAQKSLQAAESNLEAALKELNKIVNDKLKLIKTTGNDIISESKKIENDVKTAGTKVGDVMKEVKSQVLTDMKEFKASLGMIIGHTDPHKYPSLAKDYSEELKRALGRLKDKDFFADYAYNLIAAQIPQMHRIRYTWTELSSVLRSYNVLTQLSDTQKQAIQRSLTTGQPYPSIDILTSEIPNIIKKGINKLYDASIPDAIQEYISKGYLTKEQYKQAILYTTVAEVLNALPKLYNKPLHSLLKWTDVTSLLKSYDVRLTGDQLKTVQTGFEAGKITVPSLSILLQKVTEKLMTTNLILSQLEPYKSDPNIEALTYAILLCQVGTLFKYYNLAQIQTTFLKPLGVTFSSAQLQTLQNALTSGKARAADCTCRCLIS